MRQPSSASAQDHAPATAATPGQPSRAMAGCLMLLGVALIWLVITKTLSAYLAHTAPERALSLDSAEPTALVKLANARLNATPEGGGGGASAAPEAAARDSRGQDQDDGLAGSLSNLAATRLGQSRSPAGGDDASKAAALGSQWPPDLREEVLRQLETAMRSAPLNAKVLRVMGQIVEASGEEERARRLMTAAARLSLREAPAAAWLLNDNYNAGHWDEALRYADVLLRTKSAAPAFVGPFLAAMAENKEANPSVKAILEGNPPWRSRALEAMYAHLTDARTPLDIFLALKETSHPPERGELARYLNLLVTKKYHELAYYAWLQFLPADELRTVALVFNGGFERPATGLPFDWSIRQVPGVTANVVARTDRADGHALGLEFGLGRIRFQDVQQMIMLPPARYRLTGEAKGQLTGRRGLLWRVRCADTSSVIAETPMIFGVQNAWRAFSAEFEVPSGSCRPQILRLELDARSASEELISGNIFFDDVSIARVSQ